MIRFKQVSPTTVLVEKGDVGSVAFVKWARRRSISSSVFTPVLKKAWENSWSLGMAKADLLACVGMRKELTLIERGKSEA